MKWTKFEPIKAKIIGCGVCGRLINKLPMGKEIAIGSGGAYVSKDDQVIYEEQHCDDAVVWTVHDAENEALKDPEHDWRIVFDSPFYFREYQRHGAGEWMLIEEKEGFA